VAGGRAVAREALLLTALYLAYEYVAGLAADRGGLARRHAALVTRLTPGPLRGVEAHLRAATLHHHVVWLVANAYDAVLHLTLTASVLIWAWWRRPEEYRTYRWVLGAVTLAALVLFWVFPVAPPRLTPALAYVPVVAHVGRSHFTNPYAAFPSLHLAWAAWCAWVVTRHRYSRLATLAWLYPLVTGAVLVATANHYLLDLAAGALVLALSILSVEWRARTLPAAARR
jgi:PAP2 superfamily